MFSRNLTSKNIAFLFHIPKGTLSFSLVNAQMFCALYLFDEMTLLKVFQWTLLTNGFLHFELFSPPTLLVTNQFLWAPIYSFLLRPHLFMAILRSWVVFGIFFLVSLLGRFVILFIPHCMTRNMDTSRKDPGPLVCLRKALSSINLKVSYL